MYGDIDEIDKSMCFSDKAQSLKKNSSKSLEDLIGENFN
jgi:hypothetical protein